MPLFRKKDHTADDDAARVNFERLMALSTADLAAELMPAFGPDGPKHGKDLNNLVLVAGTGVPAGYPAGYNWIEP
jgi:hypothetical protein